MQRLLASTALAATAACGPVLHVGIPAPRGTHDVGRATFALTDSSRPDPWSSVSGERRVVLVKAWYPATLAQERRAPYLENAGRLPGEFQFGERWLVGHLGTHARVEPAAATSAGGWPVILFSPGADTPPEYYTGLLEDLASRGYLVLAMDHSYEGRGQVLPDGRVLAVESEKQRPPPPRDSASAALAFRFYQRRVEARAADASFIIDALERSRVPSSIARSADRSRIGALGHSLGGVAAAEICRRDARVHSCAVIDGLVRGLPVLPGPSEVVRHSLLYIGKPIPPTLRISPDSGWALVRRAVAENGGGYDVLVDRVTHSDFTDSPFMKPTVRPVAKRAQLGIVRDVVGGFFDKTLLGKPAPVLDDDARQPGVRVTRVPKG